MTTIGLDHVQREYDLIGTEMDAFVEKYGVATGVYLAQLPLLFRFFRRIPFDATLPLRARQSAAVIAFYLAEQQDFFPRAEIMVQDVGLIDDVFAAYFGLHQLLEFVKSPDVLAPHWRDTATEFSLVVDLSANLEILRERCPSKVLEQVEAFLRMPR